MAGVVDTVGKSLGALSGINAALSAIPQEISSPSVAVAASIRSPQIIQDPLAGFITQYVNTESGQLISQAPSALAVAYLRQGLSANGMPKQSFAQEPVTKTA